MPGLPRGKQSKALLCSSSVSAVSSCCPASRQLITKRWLRAVRYTKCPPASARLNDGPPMLTEIISCKIERYSTGVGVEKLSTFKCFAMLALLEHLQCIPLVECHLLQCIPLVECFSDSQCILHIYFCTYVRTRPIGAVDSSRHRVRHRTRLARSV